MSDFKNQTNQDKPAAMTPQQKQFSQAKNRLRAYRELVWGDDPSTLGFWGFELYSLLFSNVPGLAGLGLRSLILPKMLAQCGAGLAVGRGVSFRQSRKISCGRGVLIDDYASIEHRGEASEPSGAGIYLGDHCVVGKYTSIVSKGARIELGRACNISTTCRIASRSHIEIGESVLIAAYCYIGPGNHITSDIDTPIMEQGMENHGGVNIGKNSWIGTRATILDGVRVGENAIIAAHSLVKDDVPDGAIVAGTPAKILRFRDESFSANTQ